MKERDATSKLQSILFLSIVYGREYIIKAHETEQKENIFFDRIRIPYFLL